MGSKKGNLIALAAIAISVAFVVIVSFCTSGCAGRVHGVVSSVYALDTVYADVQKTEIALVRNPTISQDTKREIIVVDDKVSSGLVLLTDQIIAWQASRDDSQLPTQEEIDKARANLHELQEVVTKSITPGATP